jgi:voltage-gated potassium channel
MTEGRSSARLRVLVAGLAPLALVAVGTVGYRLIEQWGWFDALYMTVITLTTVGYGETHPLGHGGRAFTIALALGGIFTLFFTTTEVLRAVISGEIQSLLGRRRMEKKLASLTAHVIVCGFGRVGRQVCQDFSEAQVPFVAVDKEATRLADFDVAHGHPLVGDATLDEVLEQAGIARARALVAVVTSDAENVFITMSARLLNPALPIVARAEEASAVPKLQRAGATRVVSPYVIGGGRVVQAVLRPAVLDFIEVATRSEHLELQLEELPLRAGAALTGVTLAASGLRDQFSLIVVAIKQRGGHMVFNPPDALTLAEGDTIIALGRRAELERAGRVTSGEATR